VGAPADVRATAGQSSATVVWCPPATGAGSVVSYTVTSSGGQTVTARVPNDWAIVDGLGNGTSYSFTVTANTSGGTTGPSAASNSVTPEPIAPPRDVLLGQPRQVGYDKYSLMIDGRRVFITAGEFDPWRTPSPSLWLDDLQKMKADGYNAVTVYFDWDYNSPSAGIYDFTGVRDMNEFLNLAQQAGLYVIARPGPYINAETDGGGIPSWVLTSPNGYRSDTEPYLSAARQWFSQIDSIIAPHQITKGGDVIAYQIENEYTGKSPADLQYMADLEQQARSDGITVPTTFNQCCGADTFASGTGAVNITGTDNYPLGFNCADTSHFGQPYGYPSYPGMPVYLPEYQGGSFDGWGGSGFDNCYQMTGPGFENVFYKNNIAQGVTMQSNYMGVGGTNWGWLPDPGVYTSYDYGAAIRETGEIGTPADPNNIAGSKYGENKLINDFETSAAPLAETQAAAAPTASSSAVATMGRVNPSDGAEFFYVRQADATSTSTVSTQLDGVLEHPGRGRHDADLHRYRGAVDRPEEQQRGHRRCLHRRGPRRHRRHLQPRRQAVPAGPVQQDRPERGQPHADGRRDRPAEPGVLGRHRGHRRDQRPHRGAAGRLLPRAAAAGRNVDHAGRPGLADAGRQRRLRRPAPGLLHLRADDPGQHRRPRGRPALRPRRHGWRDRAAVRQPARRHGAVRLGADQLGSRPRPAAPELRS
jgi:hypothetical protein